MKKLRVFALDGPWYLHRIFHSTLYETQDLSRAIAYNFLSRVCQDAIAVKANQVMVAFDGSSVFRYDIYPEYKGQRGDNTDVYTHLKAVKDLLRAAGIPVVHRKKYEADDILCGVAAQYLDYDVVIGARDKDAYQYLRPGVRLYDSAFRIKGELRPRYVTHEDVLSLMGVPPELAASYQTLVGDKTDNVPQVVSPAKAKKGILQWNSIKNWALNDKEMRRTFKDNRETLLLNRKLVTLVPESFPEDFDITFRKSASSSLPKIYYALCNMLFPKSKGLF